MAVKDLIVLNETDSKLEAQQGTDTARIKGTADVLLDVVNESDVSSLKVDSSGSRVVFGGPVTMSGDFSGSLPSASFGRLEATVFSGSGRDITGVTPADSVSSSLQLSDAISGSWQNELSSSDLVFVDGGISGSSISTGSFGRFTAATYWSGDGSAISLIPYGGIISSSLQISDDVSGSLLNRLSGSTSHIGAVFVGGGISSSMSPIPGQRGIIGGNNAIEYMNISALGQTALDFGDTILAANYGSWLSNGQNQRAVLAGDKPGNNTMQYITISSTGNSQDFGDLNTSFDAGTGMSNGIADRGLFWGGGYGAAVNTIDYITISTTGNAADYGDAVHVRERHGGDSNGIGDRGIVMGGRPQVAPGGADSHGVNEAVNIKTTGDATAFGLHGWNNYQGTFVKTATNDTNGRIVYQGLYYATQYYLSPTHNGNATTFGNGLGGSGNADNRSFVGFSNGRDERGVFADWASYTGDALKFVTISTLGNASTFGNLDASADSQTVGATSDGYAGAVVTSSFYAMTGSFQGDASSVTGISFPADIVSSSLQLSNSISGSFLNEFHSGSLMGLGGGISSSAGVSSSFAHISASKFVGDGTGITYTLPTGMLSSSAHPDGASVTGSLKSSLGSSDLIGWWRMGDGATLGLSGSIITDIVFSNDSTAGRQASGSGEGVWSIPDASGRGNHAISSGSGAMTSSAALTGSHFNGSGSVSYVNQHAMIFDGVKDYISTPPVVRGGEQALSIAAWVSTTDTAGTIIEQFSGAEPRHFYLKLTGSKLRLYADFDGGDYKYITTDSAVTLNGSWQYWVATIDLLSDTYTLYVNGSAVASTIVVASGGTITAFASNDTDATIGGTNGGDLAASIDEVAVWNRALTAPEVTTLYNSGTGSLPSTIGYQSGRNEMSASVLSNQLFVSGGLKTGFSYGNAMSSSAPGQRGVINTRGTVTLDYVTMNTPGNAVDFGDSTLSSTQKLNNATSNGIRDRGIFMGHHASDEMDFITISTPGNATDFGDLTVARGAGVALSNGPNDRAVFSSGQNADNDNVNVMDFVTISTTGNAADFGDTTRNNRLFAGTSNGVGERGLLGPGYGGGYKVMEAFTISTTGNAYDVGETLPTWNFRVGTGISNGQNNRAIWGAGYDTGVSGREIKYMSFSSLGIAVDFGNTQRNHREAGGVSSDIGGRGLIIGAYPQNKDIEYISIDTLGDALTFGEATVNKQEAGATSNSSVGPIVDSSFSRITADRFSGIGTGITNINPSGLITSSVQLREDISGSVGKFESTYAPHSMQFYQMPHSGSADPTGSFAIANKYSMEFDGTNDHVLISTTEFEPSSSYGAVSAWLKNEGSGWDVYFGSADSNTTNFLLFGTTDTGKVYVYQKDESTGGTTQVIGATNIRDGNWHHVVVESHGASYSVYVDGTTDEPYTLSGANNGDWFGDTLSRNNVTIGNRKLDSLSEYWDGKIDEVAVWSIPLSASAVDAIYNGGIPTDLSSDKGSYTQSVSMSMWLRMGDSASFDGTNWSIYDSSGNGMTGSSVNMTLEDRVIDVPPTMMNTLRAPYPVALSGSKAATIAFWAKVGSTGPKAEYLIGDAARQGWEIRKGGTNNFQFAVLTGSSAGATASFVTDHAIPDNNSEGTSSGFAHYALTYEGGSGQIIGYVQGSGSSYGKLYETASLDFQTGSFVDTAGQGTLRFGRLTDELGSGWLGSIAEVAIWSSSLSASAISDLAEGPFDVASKTTTNYTATSSLVSYWTVTSGSYNEDT